VSTYDHASSHLQLHIAVYCKSNWTHLPRHFLLHPHFVSYSQLWDICGSFAKKIFHRSLPCPSPVRRPGGFWLAHCRLTPVENCLIGCAFPILKKRCSGWGNVFTGLLFLSKHVTLYSIDTCRGAETVLHSYNELLSIGICWVSPKNVSSLWTHLPSLPLHHVQWRRGRRDVPSILMTYWRVDIVQRNLPQRTTMAKGNPAGHPLKGRQNTDCICLCNVLWSWQPCILGMQT